MTDFPYLVYAEQCSAAIVTLKNGALASQGSLQGIYQISNPVNGKQSWISVSHAIWYNLAYDGWPIDSLEYIGEGFGQIFAYDNFGGLDDTNNQWYYMDGSDWVLAGVNDINITCTSKNTVEFFMTLHYSYEKSFKNSMSS